MLEFAPVAENVDNPPVTKSLSDATSAHGQKGIKMVLSSRAFIALRAIAPAIPPLLILVFGEVIFNELSRGGVRIVPPSAWTQHPEEIAGAEALARFTTWATGFALVAISVAAVGISCLIILKCLSAKTRWILIVLGFAVTTVLFTILLSQEGGSYYRLYGHELFNHTISSPLIRSGHIDPIETLINTENAFAVAASSYLIIALCAISPAGFSRFQLSRPTTLDQKHIDSARAEILERSDYLKFVLFSGSAVFSVGIAAMKAWNEWPASYYLEDTKLPTLATITHSLAMYKDPVSLPDRYGQVAREIAAKANYDLVVHGIVNFHALIFVLALLAILLPTAFQLNLTSKRLERSAVTSRGEYTAPPSLIWSDAVQRFAAILAPIMAAPVLDVFASVTGMVAKHV